MKSWVPHFLYCSVLLGAGLFFWQNIRQAEERIQFENQTIAAAYHLQVAEDKRMKTLINKTFKLYRNPFNANIWKRTQQADSLVARALGHQIKLDSLCLEFSRLTDMDPVVKMALSDLFYTGPEWDAWPDSLRKELAFSIALQYLGAKIGADEYPEDRPFVSLSPEVSFTTLFPAVDQPFVMDVVFSGYATWIGDMSISINGRSLALKDGVGHYRQYFKKTGNYKLKVESRYTDPSIDSVFIGRKNFYVNIKR